MFFMITFLGHVCILFWEPGTFGGSEETFDNGITGVSVPLVTPQGNLKWRRLIAENIQKTRSKIALWPWSNHTVQIDDVFTDLTCLQHVSSTEGVTKKSLHHYIQMFEKVGTS